MHIQILDLILWQQETNLFCTLLYLTKIKKIMQMLEVPKPIYEYKLPITSGALTTITLLNIVHSILIFFFINNTCSASY
jgi:hypothetical protein